MNFFKEIINKVEQKYVLFHFGDSVVVLFP